MSHLKDDCSNKKKRGAPDPMKTGMAQFHRVGRKGALAVGLSAIGLAAMAQTSNTDGAGASRLVLSAGATIDDAGETLTAGTNLEINRSTRTQRLSFSASAELDFDDGDGEDFFIDPSVRLSYQHDAGPLLIGLSVGYSETDLDGTIAADAEDDTLVDVDFLQDDGRRVSRFADVDLTIGERAPFGAVLSYSIGDLTYRNVTDPRFFDRAESAIDLSTRFDISPVLQLNAGLGYAKTENEDQLNSIDTTQSARIGFVGQVSKVLTLDGTVSYVETNQTFDDLFGNRSEVVSDGIAVRIGANLDHRNGSSIFALDRSIQPEGTIDRLTFRHETEVSKTQQLSFGLGASRLDDDETTFEGSLAYQQELKGGAIRIVAQRGSGFSSTDDPLVTQQLSATISRELTATSQISADVRFSSIEYLNNAFEDVTSTEIGVGYRHALTRDWALSGRAYHRISEDDIDSTQEQGLSISVERAFELFK